MFSPPYVAGKAIDVPPSAGCATLDGGRDGFESFLSRVRQPLCERFCRMRQALSGFEAGVPGALPVAVFDVWKALIF